MEQLDQPRLRHCTMIQSDPSLPLTLVVGTEQFELTEEIGNRDQFLQLKSLLDGRHTRDEICRVTGLEEARLESIISLMAQQGLLRREEPLKQIPISEFGDKLSASLLMWRRQIGYHRLFGMLEDGVGRFEVLQGLFIESYHVVRLAAQHISVAIAHAESDMARHLLSKYLAEEYDHSSLLFDTCLRLGLDAQHLRQAHPTVGTLSLVNMLAELGRRDTLAYCAGSLLFESGAGDYPRGVKAANKICEAYGLKEDTFAPALRHLEIDREAEHCDLLAELLEDYESIDGERAHLIVNLLHDLKHSYDLHHDEIVKYYSDISNYIPRPRVDYFSL